MPVRPDSVSLWEAAPAGFVLVNALWGRCSSRRQGRPRSGQTTLGVRPAGAQGAQRSRPVQPGDGQRQRGTDGQSSGVGWGSRLDYLRPRPLAPVSRVSGGCYRPKNSLGYLVDASTSVDVNHRPALGVQERPPGLVAPGDPLETVGRLEDVGASPASG